MAAKMVLRLTTFLGTLVAEESFFSKVGLYIIYLTWKVIMNDKHFNGRVGSAGELLVILSMLLLVSCDISPRAGKDAATKQSEPAQSTVTESGAGQGITFGEDAQQPHPYRVAVITSGGAELNPGDTHSYTITIENIGDNADVYTITASSSLGWDNLSTIPATLDIASHSNDSFVVTVTVPGNAAPTTQDVLDISAKGQHGAFGGFPTPTTVHCPLTFSDVRLGQDTDSLDYAAYYAACRNIIAGLGSGSNARFAPQEYVTRAQFAQALVVGFKLKPYTPAKPSFRDVPASDPTYAYIEAAVRDGAMQGYSDGSFQPNGKVMRGEAVNTLAHTFGYPPYDAPNPDFRDVPKSRADYAAIEAMLAQHDIEAEPCADNSAASCFRPADYITRGELSKIIRNILDR